MRTFAVGFPPVADEHSRLLVLGSFPSVKSRAVGFYYGNPRNRFWETVCSFFREETPRTVEGKKEFLARRRIALWDVVLSCRIEGSADASIREEEIADLTALLQNSPVESILCNGKTAFALFTTHYPRLTGMAKLMPSTSPANPRFSAEPWYAALREIFVSE